MKRDQKVTTIYALRHDDDVYIGHTTAAQVSAVCYSHCNGAHEETADYFNLYSRRPTLYILCRITAQSAVIERHVAAWIHVFAAEGAHILTRGAMRHLAADPGPGTAVIVQEILTIPLEERLAHCRCNNYTDADRPSAPAKPQVHMVPASDPATSTLSIHLSAAEKQQFDQIARSLGMTHRETLRLLIQCSPTEDRYLAALLQHQDSKDAPQKKRIAELQAQVSELQDKLAQQGRTHNDYVTMVRQGLTAFLAACEPTGPHPLPITVDWYDQYMRNCQTDYAYPTADGIAMVRPIAILPDHDKRTTQHILAITVNGEYIKLRYDPAQPYVGLSPCSHVYGGARSAWLYGWQRAEDNVMQLMLALPLQIRGKYSSPMDQQPEQRTGAYMDGASACG